MSLSLSFEEVGKSFRTQCRGRGLRGLFFFPKKENKPLFSGLCFVIEPGERVLFLGPNGSGKTTVLKLAGGLMTPSSGKVFVENLEAQHFPKKKMGVMLSTQLLYTGLTGYQNLEFATRLHGTGSTQKAIQHAIRRWKLETFVDDIVESYSNGQRALLALARATLMDPPLVLLDEPTAFLDVPHRSLFWRYLRTTPSTVLITSQENFPEGTIGRVIHL